jgi:hypothetical protein
MYLLPTNLPVRGFIMNSDKQAAKKEKEEELLSELVYSKLEAAWNDVKFMKKLSTRLSELESDKLVLGCLFAFAAEKGIELGQTRDEFLESIGSAFDDVADDDDDDLAASTEDVDEETERMNAEAEPEHGDDSESAHTEEE